MNNRTLEEYNECEDNTNQAGDVDGGVGLPAAAGGVRDDEADQRDGDAAVGQRSNLEKLPHQP